jgi:hypothetical protein
MKLTGRNALFAGCLALLAACDGGLTEVRGERMELAAAMQRWDRDGVDDYRMTVRTNGDWGGARAVITVRDGVPVSVRPVDHTGPGMVEIFSGYDTVEELFAVLESAVAEDAESIDASYHTRYGLPVDVYIDYRASWADDGYGFIVETFDRL